VVKTPLEKWIKAKIGSPASGAALREDLERHQLLKLRETVDYARSRSRFYQKLLADVCGDDLHGLGELSRLPFTTSQDILEDDLRFLCVSRDEIARVVTLNTTGTTSPAKRLHFTDDDLELTTDLFHHGMTTMVEAGQKVLILMPGEQYGSVGDLMVKALRRMDVEGIVHGIVRDEGKAIAEIIENRIDCIIGIPVQVLGLARHRAAEAIGKGRIKSVLLSADYVPATIVQEISKVWGCRVYNHYGMTEMGLGAAVDCRALSGYHIREADLYFEIIDPVTGCPLPDGEQGEVVFTTLTRKGMPLIRYRTGDLSGFIPEPCPCGTILKRLAWVKGRLCGQVKLGRNHWLNITELDEVLFTLPGIKNYRAELQSDNDKDCLRITLYVGEKEEEGMVSHVARNLLELVPAVRAALAEKTLTIASVGTSEENWLSTGSIKRTIIDRRKRSISS
jgi:phenylacetate-CoA ligase